MSDNAFQNATIRDEMSSIKGQVDPNSENVSFERQRERGSQKPSSPLAIELTQEEKKEIEKEVREIMGIHDDETPVILDVESIRVLGPGKFELDIINLFNKKRPLIYKLEEGKYIIDLASSMKMNS
jgi:predicted  nucleic acid-binding Zn-ribbon protein